MTPEQESLARQRGKDATAKMVAILKPFVDRDVIDSLEARQIAKREGLFAYDQAVKEFEA
jgi:hypothetical protein